MKRFNGSKRDGCDEDRGALTGERLGERGSGVRPRGDRRATDDEPSDDEPCETFEEVVAKHGHAVRRKILARLRGDVSTADDLSQKVLILLNRRIDDLKKKVPHPVKPVLYGLVEDVLRNHVRDEKRRCIDGPPDSGIPATQPDPEQLLDRARETHRVLEVFDHLEQDDRDLLTDYHFEERPIKQLAEEAGVPENTLATRLFRARARLANLFNLDRRAGRKP